MHTSSPPWHSLGIKEQEVFVNSNFLIVEILSHYYSPKAEYCMDRPGALWVYIILSNNIDISRRLTKSCVIHGRHLFYRATFIHFFTVSWKDGVKFLKVSSNSQCFKHKMKTNLLAEVIHMNRNSTKNQLNIITLIFSTTFLWRSVFHKNAHQSWQLIFTFSPGLAVRPWPSVHGHSETGTHTDCPSLASSERENQWDCEDTMSLDLKTSWTMYS